MKKLLILSIFIIGCNGTENKKEIKEVGTKDATVITKDATKVTKDATTKVVVKIEKIKVLPVKKEVKKIAPKVVPKK